MLDIGRVLSEEEIAILESSAERGPGPDKSSKVKNHKEKGGEEIKNNEEKGGEEI
jgi:hypothetical protein